MKTLLKTLFLVAMVSTIGCAPAAPEPNGGHDNTSHGPDPSGEAWVETSQPTNDPCAPVEHILVDDAGDSLTYYTLTLCGAHVSQNTGDPAPEQKGEVQKQQESK